MNALTLDHMKTMVAQMATTIIENEVYFCELDSVAGDGDFGMSIAKGFGELKKQWDTLDGSDVSGFLKACSMIITEYCGGASGPIWGSAFRGAANSVKGKDALSLSDFALMMNDAVLAIQKRGQAKLGDKTLLDALIPTADALKMASESDVAFLDALENGAKAAVLGAEKTKTMVASRGRASYVGERSLDYPDAGAMALGIIFTAVSEKMKREYA